MEEISKQVKEYIDQALHYLSNSPNVWLKENPVIIQRLANWDYITQLQQVEKTISSLYSTVDIDFPIGTIAFSWDEYSQEDIIVYFGSENTYQEWMSEEWIDYEFNISSLTNSIFEGCDEWKEEIGNEFEAFHHLFMGMVEFAVTQAMSSVAFQELQLKDTYLFLSTLFHDCEFHQFYDSQQPQVPTLSFSTDLKQNEIIPQKGSKVMFGEEYKLSTKWIRGHQSRSGKLPDDIGLFTVLEELEIDNEKLKSLPEALYTLKKLKKLNLQENKLTQLSDNIHQLSALTHLDVSNNQLKEIPASISQLPQLDYLHLQYNQLRQVPDLSAATSLTFLELYNNQITTLSDLPSSLTWLNLNSNQLSELPSSFADLKNLESLVISDNKFIEVPKEIMNLTSLTSIELGGNYIEDLPEELLSLPHLNSIRVYPNPFSIEKRKELKERFGSILFVGYDTDENSFMSDHS